MYHASFYDEILSTTGIAKRLTNGMASIHPHDTLKCASLLQQDNTQCSRDSGAMDNTAEEPVPLSIQPSSSSTAVNMVVEAIS